MGEERCAADCLPPSSLFDVYLDRTPLHKKREVVDTTSLQKKNWMKTSDEPQYDELCSYEQSSYEQSSYEQLACEQPFYEQLACA